MSATSESTPRPRRAQADRRAESDRRMIRAALRLLAVHGSAGVSMAQIGRAAGYSGGLPAVRFGSRTELLGAVVDSIEDWFNRAVARNLGDVRGLAAVRIRIATHFEGARETSMATVALYQLYVESLASVRDLRPRIADLGRAFRDGFVGHLKEARDLGEIDDSVDVERHATLIVAAMRGAVIQSLIDDGATDLTATRDDICDYFTREFVRKRDLERP